MSVTRSYRYDTERRGFCCAVPAPDRPGDEREGEGETPRRPDREDRSERASTLITSQVPVKAWHELIGEPTIADSICDRLIHTAYLIELHGPSLRETRAKAQQSSNGNDTEPPAPALGRPSGPRKRG
jgi:hypothetical protein